MSNKVELQRKLKEIGYEIGPFASKETLSNILRLHNQAFDEKGIDVAKLNDLDLRRSLTEYNLTVGPVTNHTRSIYQRKLLELITNENSEGVEDDIEAEEVESKTPPRAARSSIARGDNNTNSRSPTRQSANSLNEPRISLTRIDVDESQMRNISSFYPNVSQTKTFHSSTNQETVTQACSPKRPNAKADIRSSNLPSQALRNPYDFRSDETTFTRHEHKATPFRTTNITSTENYSNNATRFTKPIDDLNGVRARILMKNDDQNETSEVKSSIEKEKKTTTTEKTAEQKLPAKSGSSFLYAGIIVIVGLVVFALYLFLEN